MDLDYQTTSDIDDGSLTVDRLMLFQRFPQRADVERVEALFQSEVENHLRLCELAILRAAAGKYYWCELPCHALSGVNVAVDERLSSAGFILEHSREAYDESAPSKFDTNKTLNAVRITTRWTASWFKAQPLAPEKLASESKRRQKIEAAARLAHTPRPKSRVTGTEISAGDAVWAALLDGIYVVEVQDIYNQATLCIFTRDGTILHSEPTTVSYSALFGPDSGDLAHWEKRATSIVDQLKTSPKTGISSAQKGQEQ